VNTPETKRRGPVLLDMDLPQAPNPQDVPPVPEIEGRAMQTVTQLAARKSSWLSRVFWGGASALLGIALSVAMWDFVNNLLVRNVYLGQAALGILALIGLVLVIVMLKELAAFSRLAKIDSLRAAVRDADGDRPKALKVIKRIEHLYTGREELRWARQEMGPRR